jgi:MoaA/NifB/PqqE/SkfB family radical SAM enzyme
VAIVDETGAAETIPFGANRAGILAARAAGVERVAHPPIWYSIHLNEPCNQRCIMCVPDGAHGDQELTFEQFVALFDQIKSHAEHITLIGGETLMYPDILPVLDLLAQYPIGVTINTNATMLDEHITERLLALHHLELKWSIDAASAGTYLRIRGRNHFRRVTDRMLEFAERSADFDHVDLIPIYVVMRENLDEVVAFLDVAELMDPARVEFHPVRHVGAWSTDNGTGWHFEGADQVCESFPDAFNAVMERAEVVAGHKGIDVEIHRL